jgi:hypothetical protein
MTRFGVGIQGAVMTKHSKPAIAATAILFSSIMACVLGFGGLIAGMYLWRHFGPRAKDFDETNAYLCGLLVGGALAIGGGVALLWTFWPRTVPRASQASLVTRTDDFIEKSSASSHTR